MSTSSTHPVFICSCNPGKAFLSAVVEVVIARLESGGVRCWSSHRNLGIRGEAGLDEERDAVREAIAGSQVFVPVSFGGDESPPEDVQWQLDYALERELAIIPFRLKKRQAEEEQAADGDAPGWLEDMDAYLDQRLDALASKVESFLEKDAEKEEVGSKEEAECESNSESPGPERVIGRKGEKEEEPSLVAGSGISLPQKTTNYPVIEPEGVMKRIERSAEDPEGEAPGGEPDRVPFPRGSGKEGSKRDPADEGDERVSFPLPAAKLSLQEEEERKQLGRRRGGERTVEAPQLAVRGERRRRSGERRQSKKGKEPTRGEEGSPDGEKEADLAPGKWVPWICGLIVAGAIFVGLFKGTSWDSASAEAERLTDLERLGLSLIVYAAEQEDRRLPKTLEQLIEFEERQGPGAGFTEERAEAYDRLLYFGGHSWADDPLTMVAAESEARAGGTRAVLYLNASVEEISEEAFQRRRREQSDVSGEPKPKP